MEAFFVGIGPVGRISKECATYEEALSEAEKQLHVHPFPGAFVVVEKRYR